MNRLEDTLIFNFDRLNQENLRRDVIYDDDINDSNEENSDDNISNDEKNDNDYYQENEKQHIVYDWSH
jgi:hypothetical protein